MRLSLSLVTAACFALAGTAVAGTPPEAPKKATEHAIFAGGCFWCMESTFEEVTGVIGVTSGYTGGKTKNPTYHDVGEGGTGHVEAVDVEYNPAVVRYDQLLETFWHNVDATDGGGQFCDRGDQYTSEIFPLDDAQKAAAEASKEKIAKTKSFKESIATKIVPATEFYPAEDYHQDYYKKNPLRYGYYRKSCGRDARLKALWGAPAK